jgi:hypothetical protein
MLHGELSNYDKKKAKFLSKFKKYVRENVIIESVFINFKHGAIKF